MKNYILTTAAVASAICLTVCSKTPTPESVSTTLDTLAVAIDTQAVTHDTLTDTRDGQTYKTVKIGKQTWMAQNLNYQTKSGSWCYDNNAYSCEKYGRSYDWNMAKIACPKGWHLPSKNEWTELVTVVGSSTVGKKLKSKSGWIENRNGTDEYGFSALPGGYRYSGGNFLYVGNYGYWWTATENGSYGAYGWGMYYDYDGVGANYYDKSRGFSVRCVADNP